MAARCTNLFRRDWLRHFRSMAEADAGEYLAGEFGLGGRDIDAVGFFPTDQHKPVGDLFIMEGHEQERAGRARGVEEPGRQIRFDRGGGGIMNDDVFPAGEANPKHRALVDAEGGVRLEKEPMRPNAMGERHAFSTRLR